MGISVKNDEFADMFPWDFEQSEGPNHWVSEIQLVIIGVGVMFIFTCIYIKCKKQREPKKPPLKLSVEAVETLDETPMNSSLINS